jgi:hypothetical protein
MVVMSAGAVMPLHFCMRGVPIGMAAVWAFVRGFAQLVLFEAGFVGHLVVGVGIVVFHGGVPE